MENDKYKRGQIRSCFSCYHYEQPPCEKPYASDCKNRLKNWYPQRGYNPCMHYVEKQLSDEDY